MARLLHTIQTPEGFGQCATYKDQSGTTFLLVAKSNYIQKLQFSPDLPTYFLDESRIHFRGPVQALEVVKRGDEDVVLAIADGYIHDITLKDHIFMHLRQDSQKKLTSIGYNYHHLLSIHHQAGKKRKTAILRVNRNGNAYVAPHRGKLAGEAKESYLGDILVKKVVNLSNENCFAVLHSGFDLRFSVTYYQVSNKLNVYKKLGFQPFHEAPTLLVPMPYGGVLALSNYRAHFCAASEIQQMSVSEGFDLHYRKANHMLSVDLTHFPFTNCQFTAFVKIDNRRYMISTDTGRTAILYLVMHYTKVLLELRTFQVVDLGFSTVANSIAQVQDNIFFAASRFSRSILFRVMPQEPYIQILNHMPSSPPVLELAYSFNTDTMRYLPDIFVCQGGYRSGELRKISHEKWKATILSSFDLMDPFAEVIRLLPPNLTDYESLQALVFIAIKIDSRIDKVMKISDTSFDNKRGKVEESTLKFGDHKIVDAMLDETKVYRLDVQLQDEDIHAIKDLDGGIKFAKITVNSVATYILKGKIVCRTPFGTLSLPLDESEDLVCTLDAMVLESTPYVLVGYTTGLIQCFIITGQYIKPLWKLTCGARKEGLRDARFCINTHQMMVLVALDGQGNVHQYLFANRGGSILGTSRWVCKGPGATAMDSDGRLVVLYDTHKVIGMMAKSNFFLELCDFFHSPEPIKSCNVLLFHNNMVGVHQQNGQYCIVSMKDQKDTIDAHFSNQLWRKILSFENSHLLVCIRFDVRPADGSKKKTTLDLVDGRSLEIVHTFPPDGHIYTDICCLPSGPDGRLLFVAIQDDGPWKNKFPIFAIEENQIKMLPNVETTSTPKKPLTFSAITFDGKLHAVGNDYVALDLEETENGYRWVKKEDDRIDQTWAGVMQHGIAVSPMSRDSYVYLDSFHGIYIKKGEERPQPVHELNDQSARMTALCVIPAQDGEGPLLVTGDSEGKLRYRENTLYLYSQINVLKYVPEDGSLLIGTLDGGIYLLTKTECKDARAFENLARKENFLFSPPFSQTYDAPTGLKVYPTEMLKLMIRSSKNKNQFIGIDAICNASDKGIKCQATNIADSDDPMARLVEEL